MFFLYDDRVRIVRRRNAHANANCKCNGNRHPDTNADTNCHIKTYSDAKAAPNSKGPANASKALKGRQTCKAAE